METGSIWGRFAQHLADDLLVTLTFCPGPRGLNLLRRQMRFEFHAQFGGAVEARGARVQSTFITSHSAGVRLLPFFRISSGTAILPRSCK